MSPASKPADVRFYFDADVLGLAKVLAPLRYDLTYPGDPGAVVHRRARPPSAIAPRAKDSEWIPVVANAGWLIVTRDRNIANRPAELAAVRDNGAKMIALAAADAGTTLGAARARDDAGASDRGPGWQAGSVRLRRLPHNPPPYRPRL